VLKHAAAPTPLKQFAADCGLWTAGWHASQIDPRYPEIDGGADRH